MAVLQGCVRTTPCTRTEDLACERGFRSAFAEQPELVLQAMLDDLFVLPFPVVQAFRFDYAVTFVERAKAWCDKFPDAVAASFGDPHAVIAIIGNPLVRVAGQPEGAGTWDDPTTWEWMFTRQRAEILGLWHKLNSIEG